MVEGAQPFARSHFEAIYCCWKLSWLRLGKEKQVRIFVDGWKWKA